MVGVLSLNIDLATQHCTHILLVADFQDRGNVNYMIIIAKV